MIIKLACAMAVGLAMPLPAAENLAPAGDFEAEFTSLPGGWGFFQNEGGQYTTGREAAAGPHGAALRVEGTGEYAGAFAAKRPIEAGQSYLAGGLVKVEGAGQATIKLDFSTGETYLGSTFAGFVKGGEGWRAVRVKDHRADFPNATEILVAVAMEGAGKALFDNVTFEAVERFAHDADNLAIFGTVESGVGDSALGWELFHPEGMPPKQARVAVEAAHTGHAGLRLAEPTEYAVFAHDPLPLDRSLKYVLTGWVRCRAGAALIKIDFRGPDGWLGQQPAAYAPADGAWHELRVEVDLGLYPQATGIAPAVAIEGDGAEADFDDLVLVAMKG